MLFSDNYQVINVTTNLAVHRFPIDIRYCVCCSIHRQPDGPCDGPRERVVHTDQELRGREKRAARNAQLVYVGTKLTV